MDRTIETLNIIGTVSFPKLETKDDFAKRYTIEVCHLSDESVEAIEQFGGVVGYKPNDRFARGRYIKFKSEDPIIPTDLDGNSYEGRTDEVTYGSTVECTIELHPFTVGKWDGAYFRLVSVTVLEIAEDFGFLPSEAKSSGSALSWGSMENPL